MADKLTAVNVGSATAYYVNDSYYSEIHENDFTSEIEDMYRGLMTSYNITEFEDIELTDDQYERFEENGYDLADKLSELLGSNSKEGDE